MANILGKVPTAAPRNLLGSIAARVSELARMKAEFHEGLGLERLLELLRPLPDHVTVLVRPGLGFGLYADCVVIGPGKVLVLNTLHWKGGLSLGEGEEWLGVAGTDLGRPDRRAHVFAGRLDFSGHARGWQVEPAVICTAGPVDLKKLAPLVPVVPWDGAQEFLAQAFPPGLTGLDASALIDVLIS